MSQEIASRFSAQCRKKDDKARPLYIVARAETIENLARQVNLKKRARVFWLKKKF